MIGYAIAIATVLVAVVGPLALGIAGLLRRPRPASPHRPASPWDWTLTLRSTVLYTLAFNLTFFLQELFLVLPKAFTPGLQPTLFHNNHAWEGTHPLAALFQGTGVAATLLCALACRWLLARHPAAPANTRLFLLWMVYCGLLMALPQFAIGALSSGSDVGMAMTYLGWPPLLRLAAGLLALAAVPAVGLGLIRPLLALADRPECIAGAGARTRFTFLVATLPVLAGSVACIAFRVPREWIEVVLVPAWVAILGTAWMQAGAWRVEDVRARGTTAGSIGIPLAAAALLLLLFQGVLRSGIAFY